MQQRMKAENRKRQLLEVAAKVFAERGYHGATTAELASAAGVTEPILYRHFENKLNLFVTLIDEVGATVIASWKQALADCSTHADRLDALLAGNPATHERGRGVYRVIFQAMTQADADPAIRSAIRRHFERLHRFLARELDELQDAGVVRKDEPSAAQAWMMMHIAVGFGMVAPLGVAGQAKHASAEQIRDLLLHHLSAGSQ